MSFTPVFVPTVYHRIDVCFNLDMFIHGFLGPLSLTRINFNPSMDKYHMPGKVWDEIIYPFLNFNDATVEV